MRPATCRDERGMILLVVLLIISLMTVMAASLSRAGQTTRQNISSEHQRLLAKWQMLGAEAAVTAELQRELESNGGILPGASRWLQPQVVQVNGSDVRYTLRDLSACFNLNGLLSKPKNVNAREQKRQKETASTLSPEVWFQQLLSSAGVSQPPDINAIRTMLEGYQFIDPSQLLSIIPVTSAAWQKLQSQLCATSGSAKSNKPNINGLSLTQLPLLQAALKNTPGVELLSQLITNRPARGWKDQSQIPPTIAKQLPITALFSYRSNDYQLFLEGMKQGKSWTMITQLRYEKRKMRVVSRQFEGDTE